uniref:Uncharacterized protein n=1 Tax=Quercus lobata TaxID=97700 RepID=A0A7N2R917_QUELO
MNYSTIRIAFLHVYYVQGFYVVSYGLGTYVLNLLIGLLSPKEDPELEVLDGASLPMKGSDEFKPFIRHIPEFRFCNIVIAKSPFRMCFAYFLNL